MKRSGTLLSFFSLVACEPFAGSATAPTDAGASQARVEDASTLPVRDAGNADDAAASDAGERDFLYVFVSSLSHEGKFEPAAGGSAATGLSGADAFL